MWSSRPSQASAAVCYNMGYIVSNHQEMSDLTSVKFSKGPLHTEYVLSLISHDQSPTVWLTFPHVHSYDCFYMWGPNNHFNSQGDGGYVNLAVTYNKNACQFDDSTSDLYCS